MTLLAAAGCALGEFHPDRRAPAASGDLYAVWGGGFAQQPLYAVGESTGASVSGVALARGADGWVPSPFADRSGGPLLGLGGPVNDTLDSPGLVYTVGRGGRILRLETNRPSTAWELHATPTTNDLHDIWTTYFEKFAVGAAGTIVRSIIFPTVTGLSEVWSAVNPVPTVTLRGIDGFGSLDRYYRRRAFAVGTGGTILELLKDPTIDGDALAAPRRRTSMTSPP